MTANVCLDSMEFGDPSQGFHRDRRGRLYHVVELALCMAPAGRRGSSASRSAPLRGRGGVEDDELDDGVGIEDIEIEETSAQQITFAAFLKRIVTSAEVFGELVLGVTGSKQIDRHLRNLRMIKSAQTYGFLMHLRAGGIDDKTFVQILKLTESFVLRRHICGERANETETLFAKLCEVDPTDPIPATRKAYCDACPSDDKFALEFASTNYSANIIDRARYCLETDRNSPPWQAH
ncbi:hypothetical protein NKH53_26845 [Mesorhizobium australicum]|uniref:hypothetical protein n=1 Tax=Mesorhizobium australicum TaxID=536018 RepID=UPI00333984AF